MSSLLPLSRAARTRAVNAAIYVLGMAPAAWTLHLALADRLGADPVKVLERTLGLWSLRFLVIGLAITPLMRLGGPNLVVHRRAVGLVAFFHALSHVIVYLWLDLGLDLMAMVRDIVKRPYITVGMVAFVVLVPLAITSTNAIIKRLGGKAWRSLHRWVYLAAAAAALHFVMLVKSITFEQALYATLVAALLLWRVWDSFARADKRHQGRPLRSTGS